MSQWSMRALFTMVQEFQCAAQLHTEPAAARLRPGAEAPRQHTRMRGGTPPDILSLRFQRSERAGVAPRRHYTWALAAQVSVDVGRTKALGQSLFARLRFTRLLFSPRSANTFIARISSCHGSSARRSLHAFGVNAALWLKSTRVHSAAALRHAGEVRAYGSVGTTGNRKKHEPLGRLSS